MADERQAYTSRTWQTGDVITKQALNKIENEMEYVSAEVTNAVTGTINDQKLNDTIARKLDSIVKYFPEKPTEENLEHVRMYVQPAEDNGEITVPTIDDYQTFKTNFVQPYTNKAYAIGDYVEYGDVIYKVISAITKNGNLTDDAAWTALTAQTPSPVKEIDVMKEVNNLINVYTSDSQLTQEQNKIWIKQQGESVEVPTYEEFTDLKNTFEEFGSKEPYGENILDVRQMEPGYLDNGNIAPNTGSLDWVTTPYIDVSKYTAVNFSGYNIPLSTRDQLSMFFLTTFDGNKNFVEQKSGYNNITYTVENGIKYIRFAYHKNQVSDPMVGIGTTTDLVYYPYDFSSHLHNSPYTTEIQVHDIIDQRYNYTLGINRNPDNDSVGYLTETGSLASGNDWKTLDYCYVKDLTQIICTSREISSGLRNSSGYTEGLHFLCAYDENKNFIKQVYTNAPRVWIVEDGVYWIRLSYHSSVIDQIMVTSAMDRDSPYVPYGEKPILKSNYYHSGYDWSHIHWAVLGDSLTEANIRTTINYHDYIHRSTGINVTNMGVSGTGYKYTENSNTAFYQRVLNIPNNIDVITIFGSGNDLRNYGYSTFEQALGSTADTTTDTLCGCINKTIENIYTVLPTVQLGIVTPSPWIGFNPANKNNEMELYSNAIVQICNNHGIPSLDLYHRSGLRPWESSYRQLVYSKDGGNGVHPNELGHKILAPHFQAFLSELVI